MLCASGLSRYTSDIAFHLPLNLVPCTNFPSFPLSFPSVLRVIQYTVWTCLLEFLLVQRLLYCSLTLGPGVHIRSYVDDRSLG
jgi:hypothetical protein